MSEQRRKYAHNRVLIDSARVLSAQFDDALIYVTGAQLELLRNVTQYLNRLTTYAAETHPGYYLVPDDADFDDILAIVADLEETLMGNPNTIWGFESQLLQRVAEVSVGAGYTDAETGACPSGYVYVIDHIGCYHTAGGTRGVNLQVIVGGADPRLYEVPALPPDEFVFLPTHLVLIEGQYLRWRVVALETDELAVVRVLGTRMKIPE